MGEIIYCDRGVHALIEGNIQYRRRDGTMVCRACYLEERRAKYNKNIKHPRFGLKAAVAPKSEVPPETTMWKRYTIPDHWDKRQGTPEDALHYLMHVFTATQGHTPTIVLVNSPALVGTVGDTIVRQPLPHEPQPADRWIFFLR